jgi:TolB-like protein/cytochrome c-type biogenesis protein CcmH/NrfG
MPEEPLKRPDTGGDQPTKPASTGDTGSPSFWSELKRRKVFRVASVYVVTGWIIIQVAASTFENFGIPVWAFRFVALMVLLGLPVAILLTWAFELTPDGIRTTKSARAERNGVETGPETQTKRNWMAYAIGALIPTLIFGALSLFFYIQNRGSDETSVSAETSAPVAEVSSMSIAMMPLINMSSDEENAYFAGGIHEDVLTNLSRIKDLQVVSRTTMLRYAASELTLPEIGEALGVDYIVEGSVRRIGNHVRVTVQLINARNDHHLWASNYERELVDVFATQSELAREIGNAIHLELQPESVGTLTDMPTTSVRAYDLYLKSISIEKTEDTTEENVLKSTTLLEQAVEADPDFVEAWALLKRRYAYMGSRVQHRGWYVAEGETARDAVERFKAKSNRALARAIALDPDNVETRLSIAVDHVWPQPPEIMEARRQILEGVLETDPDYAMAWYHLGWWYRHLEPPDDVSSLAAFEESLKRDPFNARIVRAVLERYRYLGDEENVARLAQRLTEIVPELSEDRRLASLNPFRRVLGLRTAFLTSADESLLTDYADLWEDSADWKDLDSQYPSWYAFRIWTGMELAIFANDLDRAIGLSREWVEEGTSSILGLHQGITINGMAMDIHLARRDEAEARASARRIVELYKQSEGVTSFLVDDAIANTAAAHAVLGEIDQALELTEQLRQRRSLDFDASGINRIWALTYIDVDQAVDLALAEKAMHPTSISLDWPAASAAALPKFVTHPRVMEYYLEEGKWVDYLADRVPEYAQYRTKATE